MDAPKKRVSLSKKHLETSSGLELLSICQSITANGQIADEEIHALEHWMSQNQNSALPAIQFMTSTLSNVLEDGIITDAERQSVAEAIEKILPAAERKYAKAVRLQVQGDPIREAKAAATLAARLAAKQKRERERPLSSLNFMVAGTRHDDRDLTIAHEIRPGSTVSLIRDTENRHSRFAIAVLTDRGNMIGFVPEDYARDTAPLLDAGAIHTAHVEKVLDYNSGPIPVVVAKIYKAGTQIPTHLSQPCNDQPKRRWPIILISLIILFVVFLIKK